MIGANRNETTGYSKHEEISFYFDISLLLE